MSRSVARRHGRFYPEMRIDGLEIDPAVTDAGRRFLGLGDNPRLQVYTTDARPFLERTHRRYDLIVADAYRQPYIPFYLATQEFFRLARRHLRPGGVLAMNVAKVPGDDRLTRAIGTTLLRVCSRRCGAGRRYASATSCSLSIGRRPARCSCVAAAVRRARAHA